MTAKSAIEEYPHIDFERLCVVWQDMHKYPTFGPERCFEHIYGYFMLAKVPYEVFLDLEMLFDVCEYIAHPERFKEAA